MQIMTHSRVCVSGYIDVCMCDMTHSLPPSAVRHYSPRPSNMSYILRENTHLYVRRDCFVRVTWLIPSPSSVRHIHRDLATRDVQKHSSYVRRDWFIYHLVDLFFLPQRCITLQIATRNVQKQGCYVRRDWFVCIHDLCLRATALYDIIHRDLATRNVLVYSYSQNLNRDVEVKLT